MKQFILFLMMGLSLNGLAQTPPLLINYQGVARSGNGNPIAGVPLSLKFEILQGSASGPVVYSEIQGTVNSNAVGIFNTQIGKTTTTLSAVNWNSGPHFLRVSLDTTGASNFSTSMPAQQLVTVPYAFYAASAGSAATAGTAAAVAALNYTNNVLSIGSQTVSLTSSGTGTSGVISGSTNVSAVSDINNNYTITVNPTLTVNGSNLSISGGNTVTLPANNTSITGSGAITVNTLVPGSSYSLSVSGLTISPPTVSPLPPGTQLTYGLLSVAGAHPNYTLTVAPTVTYNTLTGSLTISNPSNGFSANYNITPGISYNGQVFQSGPPSNTVNLGTYTPWRQGVNTVTLGLVGPPSQSVGINLQVPTAELHVNGYTKLGNTAPGIQMVKLGAAQTNAVAGGITQVPFTGFTGAKILQVSVLVEATNGSGNWIPPSHTVTPNLEYHWKVNGSNIDVATTLANSANILGKNIQVLITYEP